MATGIEINLRSSEPNVVRGIVIELRPRVYSDIETEKVYWRYQDDPNMGLQYLGTKKVGTELKVPFPFDVSTRPIDVFKVGRTAKGVENVSDIKKGVRATFPQGPTFTSAVFDTVGLDIDMVFAKNSNETGDIQVEYKKATDVVWLLHGTTFAHSATTGSITIAQEADAQNYDLRLKQVGVDGYSNTLSVTVTGSGGGAGTPPTDLDYLQSEVSDCQWEIELSWTAGSGAADYTIEQKIGSGSWHVLAASVTSPYIDTLYGSPTGGRFYSYRVKQDDVEGYSNQVSVNIPRCSEIIY